MAIHPPRVSRALHHLRKSGQSETAGLNGKCSQSHHLAANRERHNQLTVGSCSFRQPWRC